MRTDYDQLAARYDEDRARWALPRDDVIAERVGSHGAVRVLDLGCGTGRWLAAQQDFFPDSRALLLGADPSLAMLAEARAKGLANLVRARAEHLPLEDMSIDYVACSYAFHHFSDKDRALDELARVLAPGGVCRINNIEPTAGGGGWVHDFFPETVAIDAARFWPPTRLADGLEARHFTVDVKVESGTEEVPAVEALADAERRVASQLALLDEQAYARGLARLRQAAALPDATLTATSARLHVSAVKAAVT